MSPSDVGEIIKPFVFLDAVELDPTHFGDMGRHPHSGIATTTVVLTGAVGYEETTGAKGVLSAGGVEWMQAGKGVWQWCFQLGRRPMKCCAAASWRSSTSPKPAANLSTSPVGVSGASVPSASRST